MLVSGQGDGFTETDKLGIGLGFGLGVPLFFFMVLAIVFGRKASAERAKNAVRFEAPAPYVHQ